MPNNDLTPAKDGGVPIETWPLVRWAREYAADPDALRSSAGYGDAGKRLAEMVAVIESLAAQVERYRALLLDVAASGVEYSDPRIDYCTVQVDTDTWRELRALAEEARR